MDGETTRAYRSEHGLSQQELADAMGMPFRTFQDCERVVSGFRPVHERAFLFATLQLAISRQDIALAAPSVRRDALELAKLITG